ncbi:MAG: PKD domain-containing protein [Candidatus Bipolaricaulota bacterium]|nr:PKD domain-containing protein [Candidatus Bipolaricaulota bacterium]
MGRGASDRSCSSRREALHRNCLVFSTALLPLALLVLLAGCIEGLIGVIVVPSSPDFAVSTTNGTAPLSVHFTPSVPDGTVSLEWSFGDGATSREENPIHAYLVPGTYSVALTVVWIDSGGEEWTATTTKTGCIVVETETPPAPATHKAYV